MRRVVVFGSINLDLLVPVERLPRPGETLVGRSIERLQGGKGANQAVAAARLGAAVVLAACVGADAAGDELLEALGAESIDITGVRRVEAATGTALVLVDDEGDNVIVIVAGANAELSVRDLPPIGSGDVVVIQLEVPLDAVHAALASARAAGATTVLNAAPAARLSRATLELVDVLVVNEGELADLGGVSVRVAGQALVVTLGPRGVEVITDSGVVAIAGERVDVVDTTGAGDCFVGALAARLSAGDDIDAAARLANRAASLCVQRSGAGPSMPTAAELKLRQ